MEERGSPHIGGTSTTKKGCRDGCRREEDDSGSGTQRQRAAWLPGIGFMRAVSRGEAEATMRALLEVGRAVGQVAGADNDNGAGAVLERSTRVHQEVDHGHGVVLQGVNGADSGVGWMGSTCEADTAADWSLGWDELGWLKATVGSGGSNTA
ncbi:hypothetical protein B0H14DRAFT_2589982 [Mycena olivaceomarginata]|nr:hypothetical protein B0H14DRAFT_2589982 [Mycena olivaceomarginata]